MQIILIWELNEGLYLSLSLEILGEKVDVDRFGDEQIGREATTRGPSIGTYHGMNLGNKEENAMHRKPRQVVQILWIAKPWNAVGTTILGSRTCHA